MTGHRRNLCVFTDRFGHGGTQHQFAELVSRLDQSKYNVLVACFSRTGEFFKLIEAASLQVVEFARGRWYAPSTIQCGLAWMNLIRRQNIELVHTFDYYTNVFAGPLTRMAGVPFLVTSRRDTGSMFSLRQRWALRRVFSQSNCVVVNSEAARESLLSEGVPSNMIRLVRNGVNIEEFHSNGNQRAARIRWGWHPAKPMIGIIANLRPEKGHDVLLQAVPEVVQQFPDAHFLLAGPGPRESELRKYVAANGLTGHVSFLGDCSNIPDLLAALDIVVLPSTSESMPNVILEAMSAGRPVIASAIGGCKELIDHSQNGLLFTSGDSHALAEQIVLLLARPELRASLGEAARKHAEAEFDINVAVKRLEVVYDELLDRVPGAA